MKRYVRSGAIFVILALDWAALHDIFEGESDTGSERLFLILSLVVFVILIVDWFRDRRSRGKG